MEKEKKKRVNELRRGAPSLETFLKRFKTNRDAFNYMVKHFLPNGELVCPHCGCTEIIYVRKSKMTFNCGHCENQISYFNGTVFEACRLYCKEWLHMFYSCYVSRMGIATSRLTRELRNTNINLLKTRYRVQAGMANYDLVPFSGNVQMDESYLGRNNHGTYQRDNELEEAKKSKAKYPVFGIYEEDGKRVYSCAAIPNDSGQYLTSKQLKTFIDGTCKPGSTIISDDFRSYKFLGHKDSGYTHKMVNHSIKEYSNKEGYSTNGIEGYWGIVKRVYYSAHTTVHKKYLWLYLAESDFRYNHRDFEEALNAWLGQCVIIPQVIDVRKMGKFANRTYALKDYQMILPKKFDDIPLDKITAEDILNCDEPVYGILKKRLIISKKEKYGGNDRTCLGGYEALIKDGGYKDYRNVVVNTVDDVLDMVADAKRYKEVNTLSERTNRHHYTGSNDKVRAMARRKYLRAQVRSYPDGMAYTLKKEFPNLLNISDRDKLKEVYKRVKILKLYYMTT